MNEIEILGSFSGLILIRNKTDKLKSCKDKMGGINWTKGPVKALGVLYWHDKEECEKMKLRKQTGKDKTTLIFLAKKSSYNHWEDSDSSFFLFSRL